MKDYIDINRKRWDELVDIHYQSKYYDVERFKQGGLSLKDLEVNELGDVTGKNLLHLQCHFGQDTLSWARLGATVTGVDFSGQAIEKAKQLSTEIGLSKKATFLQSDIYELKNTPLKPHSFDIIFTSHGTIYWLPDLEKWAELIAYYLKPSGFFYIMDAHPAASIFDDERQDEVLQVRYSYFHKNKPFMFEVDSSYAADVSIKITNKKEYGWHHDFAYMINSIIQSGLKIDFLHEFPFCSWKKFPFLEKKEDGWWHAPETIPIIPLMFSLKATLA